MPENKSEIILFHMESSQVITLLEGVWSLSVAVLYYYCYIISNIVN